MPYVSISQFGFPGFFLESVSSWYNHDPFLPPVMKHCLQFSRHIT